MVRPMVNVPQGFSLSALTTASPSPASATMMMKMIASEAANPPTGPISFFAICASDWPFRLTEAVRSTVSCTAPAIAEPMSIHKKPGR